MPPRLSDAQSLAADGGIAVLLLIACVLRIDIPRLTGPVAAPAWGSTVLGVVATLPVAVRRFRPVAVALVVSAAGAALTAVGKPPLAVDAAVALCTFTLAIRTSRRVSGIAFMLAEAMLGGGVVVALLRGVAGPYAIHTMLFAGVAWLAGDGVSARRRYASWVAGQQERRRHEEDERRLQAVREQRIRIARELHDVVAHSLTVMTVQAGVARRTLGDHSHASTVLESIETTGREAQGELRVILDLLRDDDRETPGLAPAPTLADLKSLADKVRAAGLPVELAVSGTPRPLSPALELSLYRVVQESLTNVVKHAASAPTAVSVAYGADRIEVEVLDGGRSQPRDCVRDEGSPHGIVGMRERVSAFGGTLSAEPVPGAGFRVAASVPLRERR